MLANHEEGKEAESVNKLSSGKSSRIGETSSANLFILLRWSITKFYVSLLSRISKSNSWSQSIHLINQGLDSAFFNKNFRAAWSINTTKGELNKCDVNLSSAKTISRSSFSVVV